MNVIANIFLRILGMSLTASYCILVVCLLRVLLRKMPKIFSYLLWLVVALRLVCPVLPESSFSLMGDRMAKSARLIASTNTEYGLDGVTERMAEGFGGDTAPEAPEVVSAINDYPSNEVGDDITDPTYGKEEDGREEAGGTTSTTSTETTDTGMRITDKIPASKTNISFAAAIWLGVFLILCAYGIGSYHRLKTRLAKVAYASEAYENIPVKYAPGIETPFVLGLARPVVYLPDTLTDSEAMQCLSHERVHVRRRDYLVKQFAFVLACVHWFNPVVWLAFHLMTQDMEMSCDEQALQSPALADRKAYSDTLLKMSTGKVRFGGCPLAFGENSASRRIKNIMNYKKPCLWVTVVVCVIVVACMAGLFTNPSDKTAEDMKVVPSEDSTEGMKTMPSEDSAEGMKTMPSENSVPEQTQRGIGPVQARYEAALADILQNNLENNYLKQIGTLEASIRALEDALTDGNLKLAKLQNNLDDLKHSNTPFAELEAEIANLTNIQESLARSIEETSTKKENLEARLEKMDIADMDGRQITLDYSANKYLNQPGINCFLMQNFNTSQIDLDFLFYDGAGLENSELGAEELQALEGEIFYHFTGEQIDSFLREKTGLPLAEIQYGTSSGNTLKDSWEYLEEYDSYTLFAPKGDTFYTEVKCSSAFSYYNGILRLDYKNADKKASNAYPLVEGSLYLAPMDDKNGDVNHLNSYVIIGNVIHKGSLKDRDSDNAFDLSGYLNRLKQIIESKHDT